MADIRVIIFDFDGVIVESVDIKTGAFAELFKNERAHVEAIVNYHKANGGISRMAKIRHIYTDILKKPLSESDFERLCQKYADLVQARVKTCPYVAGAFEFLEKYAGQFDCYVVSGTPHEEVQEIVKARNLGRFFKGVYGSPKLKALWVKEILQAASCLSHEAVFVGDALADYTAAHVNHMHFVARIAPGEDDIFKGLDVPVKIKDLTSLHSTIKDRI